jgi:hypothetical protein
MPEVPKRGWPEPGPQPSPEQMQMAAAALAQGFEPSNEGLSKEDLEAHSVKLLSGMRSFVNPERFHEA